MDLQGAVGEHVTFVIVLDGRWLTYACVMDEMGTATLFMVNTGNQCKLVSGMQDDVTPVEMDISRKRENKMVEKVEKFRWKNSRKSNHIKL